MCIGYSEELKRWYHPTRIAMASLNFYFYLPREKALGNLGPLVTWSLDYAKAYRASSHEKEARHIKAQVMQFFYSGTNVCSHEDEERLIVS